jgi:hypothetical protein
MSVREFSRCVDQALLVGSTGRVLSPQVWEMAASSSV